MLKSIIIDSNLSHDSPKKYFQLSLRGKILMKVTKFIIPKYLKTCFDLLLQHREKLGINHQNCYSFALPESSGKTIRHLNANTLLKKFSLECNAQRRDLLTASKIR